MFAGFSPETIDFLWGIRMNNNRDWFLAHKDEYERYLYRPMKELGQALFEPFRDIPGLELKVSRIYRDARLHPPVPYKESLWICIRRHVESWDRNPALFFEIRPEGASCGFLLWRPATAAMESFRQALAGRPGSFPGAAGQGPGGFRADAFGRDLQAPQALRRSGAAALLSLEGQPGGRAGFRPRACAVRPRAAPAGASYFLRLASCI